jgi:uncharacterized protein YuzE
MGSIKFSRDAKALYIKLDTHGKRIAQTIPLGNDRFMDVDENGNILGFEIILPADLPKEAYDAILKTSAIEITS